MRVLVFISAVAHIIAPVCSWYISGQSCSAHGSLVSSAHCQWWQGSGFRALSRTSRRVAAVLRRRRPMEDYLDVHHALLAVGALRTEDQLLRCYR